MDPRIGIRIPVRGIPKPRPRVTKRGTHNPDEYTDWKNIVAAETRKLLGPRPPLEGPLFMGITWASDSMYVVLAPIYGEVQRPKHMRRSDVDNLSGGVMDALQQARVYRDDKQIWQLEARVWESIT